MSVEPSNHLILCHLLLLLLSIFPSIRVFSSESALCIMWPKYWSFSFSISPSNEYTGLISFRIDWFDFLAVQGALKSLQHTVRKHQSFGAQPSLWPKSNTERIRLLKTNEEGDSDVWWRDLPLVGEENGLHGNGRNCSKGVKASRCLQQESEGFWIWWLQFCQRIRKPSHLLTLWWEVESHILGKSRDSLIQTQRFQKWMN